MQPDITELCCSVHPGVSQGVTCNLIPHLIWPCHGQILLETATHSWCRFIRLNLHFDIYTWGLTKYFTPTLLSECFAHENHINFLKPLGYWPRPEVILILTNGLESNLQKTLCQNVKVFLNVVFCILLPSPFDKLDLTRGRGQWPGLPGELPEINVHFFGRRVYTL